MTDDVNAPVPLLGEATDEQLLDEFKSRYDAYVVGGIRIVSLRDNSYSFDMDGDPAMMQGLVRLICIRSEDMARQGWQDMEDETPEEGGDLE